MLVLVSSPGLRPLYSHDLLTGLTYRYTYYDDNTPATADANDINKNKAAETGCRACLYRMKLR